MAKHVGRGISAIEYPTGMNQNGDPSTVPVVLAAADRIGHELKAEFREMTNEPRSGELLPEHLLSSVGRSD